MTKKLTARPSSLQGPTLHAISLRSHALALAAALLVVTSGALAAHTSVIPQAATTIATTMREVASGFNATFGTIPAHIAENISGADEMMRAQPASVAERAMRASARIAFSVFDLS